MANLSALYQDPQFQALTEDKKSNVIVGIVGKDPDFQKLPDDRKAYVLNGIMAKGREQWTPKKAPEQESLGKNIAGSAATIADQAAGLIVGGAQAAGQAFGWAKNALMGKPQAAQEAVAAVSPFDHLQGGYSKLVDAAFGEGTSAHSTVGHFFGQVGQKIQQGQEKYAGKDPEKQAQAKVVTDFAMNYMLPHALGLAGKAVGKLTGAKVEVPPVDSADLKAKLNQIAPDMPAEQVDTVVKEVAKSLPEVDKHINAETKAHDLLNRNASKKEVAAVIKKNPLVGTKLEEIKASREAMVAPGEREVPSDMLRPQRELQARAEKKAGEVEAAWQKHKGTPISKEEAFQKAEADRAEQERLAATRRTLFEEEAAGKVQEPSQRGGSRAFRQAGSADKRLMAGMAAVGVSAAAFPFMTKEQRQNLLLMGALGTTAAVGGEHINIKAPALTLSDFKGVFSESALKDTSRIVMMSPEEFNKLAYPREATYRDLHPDQIHALGEEKRGPVRESLYQGKPIHDIPSLDVKEGKVMGHDGRHRMDVMQEMGYDKVPVRIKGDMPVEGQMLTSETGDFRTQAPLKIPRVQAGAVDPELLAKMGLTAGGALAGYLIAGQNKADKPAGAILGALLGFGGVHAIAKGGLPKAIDAISTNWNHSLATTITSAGAVGVGAYLDEENRLEGALFGAAFAASRNMPKAKHLSEEELIAAYHDGLVAHDRTIGNVVSAVKQYIPDENARKAFYEKLHRKDFSNMTPGEKEVAATWKRLQVQYGEAAKDAGVIKGFIEDYVPRIASKMGMPESEVQKILAEIVPERTNVSGSTKTKFSKSRTQDTFDDFLRAAKEKGLDVSNVDFADVMGNYLRSMNKAIQSAKLIKTLEEAKGKDGTLTNLIVGAEKAPSDYKTVNNPQLRGKRVHPEIADALEIVMGGKNHHDVTNAALAVTSALKRMNVVGSFFHAKSLIEAHLLAGRNPAGLHGIRSALEAFKNGGAGDNIDKLIRSGLMVGLPDDAPIGTFGKLGELLDHAINRSLGTGVKTFGKAFTAAEKAQMATFDKVTWDFLHTGFKLSAALREMELYRTGKKYQGMSEQEALKGISSAINDTYGGINWARAHQEAQTVVGRKLMSLVSTPNGRDMMGLLLFAPDWTLSTLRMFSKALPGGTANPANAALSRKYVRNSIIAYMTAINMANIAFSGHPIWENKKDKTKIELPDGTSMQLMKHSMEPYEFINHPTKFLTNKLGVPVKLGSLALTGSTSFNPMYPVDSKVGAAVSLVSPFTVNPFTDPNVSTQEALLRSAAGTLGVGIYGTTNAMKQTEDYKRRQRERYARMHGRAPKR